jgi:hypothetical protein
MTPESFSQDPEWIIELEEGVIAGAKKRIRELYPDPPESVNMAGWLIRWIQDLQANPFFVLGGPPRKTDWPQKFRFPADRHKQISGIADVDYALRRIVILEIEIRPRKEKKS